MCFCNTRFLATTALSASRNSYLCPMLSPLKLHPSISFYTPFLNVNSKVNQNVFLLPTFFELRTEKTRVKLRCMAKDPS